MSKPISKTVKLSEPFTDADIKLMLTRIKLYRSLWSCYGFLTGEPNINDALDGLAEDQRIEFENKLMQNDNYIRSQLNREHPIVTKHGVRL